tara:strand:- start:53539 stop:53763 length:225 start_codon:yes stop_codon:yes gene_type:complete
VGFVILVPPKVGSAMPEVTVPGNLCAAFKSLYPRGQVAVKWPLGLSAPTKIAKIALPISCPQPCHKNKISLVNP